MDTAERGRMSTLRYIYLTPGDILSLGCVKCSAVIRSSTYSLLCPQWITFFQIRFWSATATAYCHCSVRQAFSKSWIVEWNNCAKSSCWMPQQCNIGHESSSAHANSMPISCQCQHQVCTCRVHHGGEINEFQQPWLSLSNHGHARRGDRDIGLAGWVCPHESWTLVRTGWPVVAAKSICFSLQFFI